MIIFQGVRPDPQERAVITEGRKRGNRVCCSNRSRSSEHLIFFAFAVQEDRFATRLRGEAGGSKLDLIERRKGAKGAKRGERGQF